MPSVTVSGVINAPREEVYNLLADYGGKRRLEAFPGILHQKVVNQQDDTAEVVTHFAGVPDEVVDRRRFTLSPPSQIREDILESPVLKGSIIYRFEQVPEGTKFILEQRLGIKGQKWGFFQHFRAMDLLKKAGEEAIDNIKRYLEGEQGTSG